jgi:large subunit ribosomal protein L10
MSKPVKDLMSRQYRQRYEGVQSACVVSVIGLDAVSTNRLRGELRAKDLRLQVVKNSLARRAFVESPLEPLRSALQGPCALVTGGESAIDTAKTLVALKKSFPQIELKVGLLDGETELIEVEQLARMKNLQETLGELAMLIGSPAGRLAGCLAGPGGRIAGCLKAIAEKGEQAEAG